MLGEVSEPAIGEKLVQGVLGPPRRRGIIPPHAQEDLRNEWVARHLPTLSTGGDFAESPARVGVAGFPHNLPRMVEVLVPLLGWRPPRRGGFQPDHYLVHVAEPDGAVTRRNLPIYAAFAFVVLVIQLGLLATVDETALPVFAPLCLLGLPALAWAAGWLTIGLSFGSESRPEDDAEAAPVHRSPRLGAVICLAPNLLLCCWLFALFVFRR